MNIAYRLGVFIFGTLFILAVGIFLIGNEKLLFSSTYRLKADFPNVGGLENGAEVRIGGIHKGTVNRIQLPSRPDEKMTVVMDLDQSTRDIIKKDSVASIQTEGLLGSKYVEVSFGSAEAPKVNDGDTVAGQPPLEFSELLEKADQILDSTKETMSNVTATTGSLKDVSSKIDQGKGTVGALINDKQIYQQLYDASAQAKAGATDFQENMEALKHNFFLRGFFNRRGYDDSTELTKHQLAYLPDAQYIKKFVYDPKRTFSKPDSAKLKNEKGLNEAGQFLEQNKFGLAVVKAYSGPKGDADKDQVVTEARAMAVRDYLVNNFKMDDQRIKTMGMGKNGPANAGDDGGIEILVYPVGATIHSAKGAPDLARSTR